MATLREFASDRAKTRLVVVGGAVVVSFLLVSLASQRMSTAPTVLSAENPWVRMPQGWGEPAKEMQNSMFDWTDDNVHMFELACDGGNQDACQTLAQSEDALAALNRRSAKRGDWQGVMVPDTRRSEETKIGDWDNTVPLAYPIEQKDLANAGDVGNVLVPADEVRPIISGGKQSLAMMPSGRDSQLALYGGLARQGLLGMRSLARKPFYTANDPCKPDGPLCGPLRPAVDHGADLVLTDGWMGEVNPRPCCPCMGNGVRVINYNDYAGAGQYNPYTMELCQVCDGCMLE